MRICDILCRHNVLELVDELCTEAAGEVQSNTEFVLKVADAVLYAGHCSAPVIQMVSGSAGASP